MTRSSGNLKLQAWAELSAQDRYQASVGGTRSTREKAAMAPFKVRLILTDAIAIGCALAVGLLVSSRQSAWLIDPLLAIYGTPILIALLWIAMLFLRGAYDQRIIGLGPEEIRRVFSATLYTFAVVAGTGYLIRADISRAYALVSLPLGLVLIVSLRFTWRQWLYKKRYGGEFLVRTVVCGNASAASALTDKLTEDAFAGFQVVGVLELPKSTSSALGVWLDRLDGVLEASEASAVAIDPGDTAPAELVRQLAWRLEGRGIDLLISPGLLDVAGPRLSVRPAAGLPLLHLDEVALSRPQRFAKRSLDIAGSLIAIVLLSPLFLGVAVAVRLSSRGPVIFRQRRIGRWGHPFVMLKFRTMSVGAETQQAALRKASNHEGPMFKLSADPRITRVGHFLRRWSLDELPQLFNVLGGAMSLVGPRPHPMDDVDRYGSEAFRRLALKPGMTGLWQVEGRSDLDWQQALQLDLFYVERWSLAVDIVLLTRTLGAVIRGRGAF